MYANLTWLDHVVTPDRTFTMEQNADGTVTLIPAGTVIQQGTNMSAANFNNIEMGITDHDLAMQILITLARSLADRETVSEKDIADLNENFARILADWETVSEIDIADLNENLLAEIKAEEKTVTLTNSDKYPFNGSIASVSMAKARNTKNYTVEAEVTTSDGNVGEIVISDKTLNGFKIAFTGSAKNVTATIKIRGGILA